jgi:acid stress-induced BolA-like protein IbaG/YrbA
MELAKIEALLQEQFPCTYVKIDSRDTVHYEAIVVSEAFVGLSGVKRHQLVYGVLGPLLLSGDIHALALKTLTPAEWEKKEKMGE